jgi:valyl-tRNA synthetase
MSRKLWGAAVVTAAAIALPVGSVFAHGQGQPPVPSGHPSGMPSAPPSLPAAAGSHGHGAAAVAQIHQDVQTMQGLQRQIVQTRLSIVHTLQAIRAALVADVKAGDTAAVQSATTELQQAITTARSALQDQRQAQALQRTQQGQSSASGSGATTALSQIITFRQDELSALQTLESQLQQLLQSVQSSSNSSSSSGGSSSSG